MKKENELTLPQIMAKFPDEKSAIDYFESLRWPAGVECPHCKSQKKFWKISGARAGLRQCATCKKQFRVTKGTIFEDSHIKLHIWLIAWFLMCGAKKGMSALQLQRHLGIGSYKTAWFMAHRIRHTMTDYVFPQKLSGVVEVDETYVGGRQTGKGKLGPHGKIPVLSMVERGGMKRSVVMGKVNGRNLKQIVMENVAPCSTLVSDEYNGYAGLKHVYDHREVKHSAKEFARREKDMVVHTNTVEGSFALLKRGIIGSFHHVSRKHLPLYAGEFDFRWNHRKITDGERTVAALGLCGGKRLTLRNLVKGH